MEEETWTHQDCRVFEAPGSTGEPFTYIYRVERGGSEVFRYTIAADAASVKAHWPDVNPARSTDLDVIWSSLSSLGFARVRAKIDMGDLTSRILRLTGSTEVEE
jgi:hypothetical protein